MSEMVGGGDVRGCAELGGDERSCAATPCAVVQTVSADPERVLQYMRVETSGGVRIFLLRYER